MPSPVLAKVGQSEFGEKPRQFLDQEEDGQDSDKKRAARLAFARIRARFGGAKSAPGEGSAGAPSGSAWSTTLRGGIGTPSTATGGGPESNSRSIPESMQSVQGPQITGGVAGDGTGLWASPADLQQDEASPSQALPAAETGIGAGPAGETAQSGGGVASTGASTTAGPGPGLVAPASAGPSLVAASALGGGIGVGPSLMMAGVQSALPPPPPAPTEDFLGRVTFVRNTADLAGATQQTRLGLAAGLGAQAALADDGAAMAMFTLCAGASPAALAAAAAGAGMVGWIPFVGWATAAALMAYGATVSTAFATLASQVLPSHGAVAAVRNAVRMVWGLEHAADPSPVLRELEAVLYSTGSILAAIGAGAPGSQVGKADELARLTERLQASRGGIQQQLAAQAAVIQASVGIPGLAAVGHGSMQQLGVLASIAFGSAVPMIAILPFAAPAALGFGAGFTTWAIMEGQSLGAGPAGAMNAIQHAGTLSEQLQQVDQTVGETIVESEEAHAGLLASGAESEEDENQPPIAQGGLQSIGAQSQGFPPPIPAGEVSLDVDTSTTDEKIAKQGIQKEPLPLLTMGPLAAALTSRMQIRQQFQSGGTSKDSDKGGTSSGEKKEPGKRRPLPALVVAFPKRFAALRAELLPLVRTLGQTPGNRWLARAAFRELIAIARTARAITRLGPGGPSTSLVRRFRLHRARLARLVEELAARAFEKGGEPAVAPSEGSATNDKGDLPGDKTLSLQLAMDAKDQAEKTLANVLEVMEQTQRALVENLK